MDDVREAYCPFTVLKSNRKFKTLSSFCFCFFTKEGKQASIFSGAPLMTVAAKLELMSEQCLTIKGECVPDL